MKGRQALMGNRISTYTHDWGATLIAHPSGQAYEIPSLTIITSFTDLSEPQVKTVQAEPGSHHPIYQIKFADGIGGVDEVPFLAVRSQYWIKVYRVLVQDLPTPITDPEQENSKAKGQSAAQEVLVRSWSLREYSSLQSRSRILDFSWNPHIFDELVYTCEDGSRHLADVRSGSPGWPYDIRQKVLLEPDTEVDVDGQKCPTTLWCKHPRLLYLAEGVQLKRLDCRKSTILPPSTTVFRGPSMDTILCMATCKENLQLLAVCSVSQVFLFDIAQPGIPVLRWSICQPGSHPQHLVLTLKREDPIKALKAAQQAVFHQEAGDKEPDLDESEDFLMTQASQAYDQRKQEIKPKNKPPNFTTLGCITACNHWDGKVVAYRFGHCGSNVAFTAHPPKKRSKKDKSQAQEPEDFGEVKLETVTPMLGPDEHGSSRGTLNPLLKFLQAGREGHTRDYVMEHQAVSGAYMPKVGERFHAVEIPQNLVVPLRREADFREQFTGDPHPSNIVEDKIQSKAADILGLAMLPLRLANNILDSLIVRLSPMGDLFLDPTCIFKGANGLGIQTCSKPRQSLRTRNRQLAPPSAPSSRYGGSASLGKMSAGHRFDYRVKYFDDWQLLLSKACGLSEARQVISGDDRAEDPKSRFLSVGTQILENLKVPITPEEIAFVLQRMSEDETLEEFAEGDSMQTCNIPSLLKGLIPKEHPRFGGRRKVNSQRASQTASDPEQIAQSRLHLSRYIQERMAILSTAEEIFAKDRSKTNQRTGHFQFQENMARTYNNNGTEMSSQGRQSPGDQLHQNVIGSHMDSYDVAMDSLSDPSKAAHPCDRDMGGSCAIFGMQDDEFQYGEGSDVFLGQGIKLPILQPEVSEQAQERLHHLEQDWIVKQGSVWKESVPIRPETRHKGQAEKLSPQSEPMSWGPQFTQDISQSPTHDLSSQFSQLKTASPSRKQAKHKRRKQAEEGF